MVSEPKNEFPYNLPWRWPAPEWNPLTLAREAGMFLKLRCISFPLMGRAVGLRWASYFVTFLSHKKRKPGKWHITRPRVMLFSSSISATPCQELSGLLVRKQSLVQGVWPASSWTWTKKKKLELVWTLFTLLKLEIRKNSCFLPLIHRICNFWFPKQRGLL